MCCLQLCPQRCILLFVTDERLTVYKMWWSVSDTTQREPENPETAEIAAKIRYLFETYRKPDNTVYSYNEVEHLSNGAITSGWLSRLAANKVRRPGLAKLTQISSFFGVSADFWTHPLDAVQRDALETHKTQFGAHQLALRARDLPDEDIQLLLDMVDSLKRRRGVRPSDA